jgi:hypothetical protein
MAREWVHEIIPMEDLTPRGTVMFYQGKRGEVQIEGRQEKQIIGKIQHMMTRYNRPETLVVWGPNVEEKTFLEQIELFESASLVIGPDGSGLANLLLASPPNNVKDKTQNCETRLDYHHLFLQPESISESGSVGTAQTAVVDISAFHLSLYELFGDRVYRGSITVS